MTILPICIVNIVSSINVSTADDMPCAAAFTASCCRCAGSVTSAALLAGPLAPGNSVVKNVFKTDCNVELRDDVAAIIELFFSN